MTEERDLVGEELLRLVGMSALANPDSPIWTDERFVQWLQSRPPSAEDAAADQALADGIRASALGVRLVRESPPTRHDGRSVERNGSRVAPRFDQSVAAGIGRELWGEEAEEWIELPDDVVGGDFIALRIAGGSMDPLVHAGDTVLVKRGPEVRPSTVVVARDPANGYICKRVRSVNRRRIRLESLAPGHAPIDLPNDASLILGTVLMIWCEHRG
jgi:SOS-response transcriptional repressor LexA